MSALIYTPPRLVGTCHFAALQPLLSQGYSASQVRSLIALSLLFMQKLTFTDTQIADSPLLYKEFRNPASEVLSDIVRDALVSGEARLLLRDGAYEGREKKTLDIKSLADVYRSWEMQGLPGAWVVPSDSPDRRRYVDSWNELIPQGNILTYDYVRIKETFQDAVRASLSWPELNETLSADELIVFREVTSRNWFSHSQIFDFFGSLHRNVSSLTARYGLLDEASYAQQFGAGISATDVPQNAIQDAPLEFSQAVSHVNGVMRRAFENVQVSDLSLLRLLTFEEILKIREGGKPLRDLVIVLNGKEELSDGDLQELSQALVAYWRHISDSLAELHSGAALQKTSIGLTIGKQSIIPLEQLSDGIAVVLSGILGFFTGGPEGQKGIIKKIIDAASFRFLFSGPRTDLVRLRQVLGHNAVLTSRESKDERQSP